MLQHCHLLLFYMYHNHLNLTSSPEVLQRYGLASQIATITNYFLSFPKRVRVRNVSQSLLCDFDTNQHILE